MAAKHKRMAGEHTTLKFRVPASLAAPLAWSFGTPARGAFDGERALLEHVLRFVNGEESRLDPTPAEVAGRPALQQENLSRMREDWRAALRQFVTALRSNRKAAALLAVPEHLLALHNVSIMPKWEAAGAHLELWVPINGPDTVRSLFVLLLADEHRPFGRALCRCRLKDCQRFFLEVKPATGRPQRLYCSRKHMLAAHAARER